MWNLNPHHITQSNGSNWCHKIVLMIWLDQLHTLALVVFSESTNVMWWCCWLLVTRWNSKGTKGELDTVILCEFGWLYVNIIQILIGNSRDFRHTRMGNKMSPPRRWVSDVTLELVCLKANILPLCTEINFLSMILDTPLINFVFLTVIHVGFWAIDFWYKILWYYGFLGCLEAKNVYHGRRWMIFWFFAELCQE